MSTSILDYISTFNRITIQCHNNPDSDTLASAWGLYLYLQSMNKTVRMIYSGHQTIKKRNLLKLISLCEMPISFVGSGEDITIQDDELLLVVDAQYGAGNIAKIPAGNWAVIDHHPAFLENDKNILIKPDYQSCSTIIWELLMEKDFPVEENRNLKIALSYGLYTDTSEFADLHNMADIKMKFHVGQDYAELDSLKKSNLTMSELMVAADAIYHNFSDFENHFMVISALKCDQTILGVIGDLAIQVDMIELVVSLTSNDSGYQFSIRSCGSLYKANGIAVCLAEGVGSGGGHANKAGGFISSLLMKERFPNLSVEDFVVERIQKWISVNH